MSASGAAARRPWVQDLGVQDWFRLVFAAIGVLAVTAAVLVAWLTAQTRGTSNELVNSILPAQVQAYRLQGALVDQETGVRGYGLTGDVRFLQPYTTGLATEKAAAAQLRVLIGGKKLLTADLARIERAAQAWRAGYAVPSISKARRGPLTGNDLTLLDQGKAAFDRFGCCSPPRTPTCPRRRWLTAPPSAGPVSSRTGSTPPSWRSSCSRPRPWRSCWTAPSFGRCTACARPPMRWRP